MPLRGKILNTWEVDRRARSIASQEVHDISVAHRRRSGHQRSSGLRYHKICILADADSDGLHIATLLCALFLRHFRPLVAGHVFVAMPPLFRVDVGKEVLLRARRSRAQRLLDRIEAEKNTRQVRSRASRASAR